VKEPVHNPYVQLGEYRCFGCSPDNEHGLHMEFSRDGEEIECRWEPHARFQGYPGVLHGGIQATLMDEAASWFVYAVIGTAGVTAALTTRFLKPVFVDRGTLTLRARLDRREGRSAFIRVDLSDAGGTLCSTGECEYALYSPEVARKRLNYPGQDAFG